MLVLAIDTSSNRLSVALCNNENVCASYAAYMERGQGEALMPVIESLFASAQTDIQELDAVAVAVGPGSFTGVRLGLAAARGIGLALDIPVWGVSNFEAAAYRNLRPCVVALDTKRGDFYAQVFETEQKSREPFIATKEQLETLGLPIITDTPDSFDTRTTDVQAVPDHIGENLIQIALSRQDNPLPPEPLYLREADVTVKQEQVCPKG